ncbi:hypothetical protein AGMMS49938_12960 [Fibrobacterales bacterium]|nr:hypothetical protein AGMMS49938_12960 [Fibrobacterales bacterium]
MALDGPRGPAGVAKDGAAWLSSRSATPLMQVEVKYGWHISLNSWDKTKIPLPFSRVTLSGNF